MSRQNERHSLSDAVSRSVRGHYRTEADSAGGLYTLPRYRYRYSASRYSFLLPWLGSFDEVRFCLSRPSFGIEAMARLRTSGLTSLIFVCIFLLISRFGLASEESSSPDLDAAELKALGIEDELIEEDPVGFDKEEFGEDDFATDGEEYGEGDLFGGVPDPDVVVLSSSNFSEFVRTNLYVMVEFYAPWCGHCQALAPEYANAATELKPSGVSLAKIDATVEFELAQEHNVQGYPTILFFVDGKPKPYTHHRTSDAIVSWLKKKIGPAAAEVNNASEVLEVVESGKSVVVGLFAKLEGNEVEEFTSAARQEDDVLFYYTKDRDVAELLHIKQDNTIPAIVVLKSAAEKVVMYEGKFDRAAISEFVIANKLPLVSYFSRDTATSIFESSIKKQVILFASPEDAKAVLPSFEEAAKSYKGKIIFVFVNSIDEEVGKPIVEFFGVTVVKPAIVAFTVSDEKPTKFLLEDEPSEAKIKEFATSFLEGHLKQFYKSEPIPDENKGDVKVVVGKNFDEIVLDESKDVLLEIYAPWCGHCQALEPIYEKLGKALHGVNSLVIAKMDGTVNEHPRAKSDGFPTLLFFPAGSKSFDPITVDVERTVKNFYQFLKKNAAIPFSIVKPGKVAEAQTDVKASILESSEHTVHVSDEAKDEL